MRTSKPTRVLWAILLSTVCVTAAYAQTSVQSSLTTVDELLRRENDVALNKARGTKNTDEQSLLQSARSKRTVEPLKATVDAIYGTDSLKADLTISGQSISVTEGSVISSLCRVTAIADRCVLMTPVRAQTNRTNKRTSDAAMKAAVASKVCPARSCWEGAVAVIPTTAQANLGLTPPTPATAQPRPLTPLPTANGMPPGAQDFPVTVSTPDSLRKNESLVRPGIVPVGPLNALQPR